MLIIFTYLSRFSRPSRKVLRIKAGIVFEPWQEVTFSNLIFAIYLWSHGLRAADVQRITNISRLNLIKLFQRVRESCSNQLLRNPVTLEETIKILLFKLKSLKYITSNG